MNYFYVPPPEYIVEPYSSIEEVFQALRAQRGSYEVKYIAPETQINWEWKIRHCVSMIKINKFIYNNFYELRKKYQFEYYNKLFWSETTCSIEYDYNNYKFTTKSGLSFLHGKVEVINTRVDVHTQLEKFLGGLLNQIRNTLPSSRAKDLLKLYEEIKQSPTY